jgi:hypothetical protein
MPYIKIIKVTSTFLNTILYFWLYSQKVCHYHFSSQYVITEACLTHAHSVYAALTIRCLEMKHNHRR